MKEAKISEMFLSLQGEGIYMGIPQLFIRFYGCDLSCDFCDTKPTSYKTFTPDSLMSKILEYKETYHSISLTGGEPLCQVAFIKTFLEEYKKYHKKMIYLETNGSLYKALPKIIEHVDIIAMDFKLPSSTLGLPLWKEHERFLRISSRKEVFVKSIITQNTTSEDIIRMIKIVGSVSDEIPIVLQPATVSDNNKKVTRNRLSELRDIAKKTMRRVEIIPQIHKEMGIR